MSTITGLSAPTLSGALATSAGAIQQGLGAFDRAAAGVAAGEASPDALAAALAARATVGAAADTLHAADRMIGTLLDAIA
jgi:2-methylcitrate dehydratase PrpD